MRRLALAVLRYFGWRLPPQDQAIIIRGCWFVREAFQWPSWPVVRADGDRQPQARHLVRGRWVD